MFSGYDPPTTGGPESWHGANLLSVTVPDPNRNTPPNGRPVSMTVMAKPGYCIDSVQTGDLQILYVNPILYDEKDSAFFGFASPANDVHSIKVAFKKKTEYTLDVKVKQMLRSANSAKCNAYVTASPARKYYAENDEVTLTATSNSTALKFKQWKGYLDLTESSADYKSPTITIKMSGFGNSPPTKRSLLSFRMNG